MNDDYTAGDTMRITKVSSAVKPQDNEENLERTMTIPVIKATNRKSMATDTALHTKNAEGVTQHRQPVQRTQPTRKQSAQNVHNAKGTVAHKSNQPVRNRTVSASHSKASEKTSGQSRKNVLIFIVVFLLVILAGLWGMSAYLGTKNRDNFNDTLNENVSGQVEEKNQNVFEEPAPEAEEPLEEQPKRDSGTSLGSNIPYEPLVDINYSFGSKAENGDVGQESESYQYSVHSQEDYFLEYKIPSEFVLKSVGGAETRYVSEDNTAYVDIGYMLNSEGWGLRDVIDSTVERLGGVMKHEIIGNDSFILSTEVNGVYYYQKCYVSDDFVRYFEVSFPTVYRETYSNLASGIESGFNCVE